MGIALADVLVSLSLAAAATSEPACVAAEIVAPEQFATITDVRPEIVWRSVPQADTYRVQLISREPEGGTLATYDALVTGDRFSPPQPLANARAIVSVVVRTGCNDSSASPLTDTPARRFYIDARSRCQLVAPPVIETKGGRKRIAWRPTRAADAYDVFAYAADDGRLLFSLHPRDPAAWLPDGTPGQLAIAVRARCGGIIGAPVYLVE